MSSLHNMFTDHTFFRYPFFRSYVGRLTNVSLNAFCRTQFERCKVTLKLEGGVEAAGDVAMKDIDSNPLTKEQFQLLESIVFPTRPKPKEKRKPVDFSEYSEKKWEERLYVVCIPLNNFAPCDGINLIFTLGSHTQISRNHLTVKSLSDCKWGTALFYSLCMTFSLRFRPLHLPLHRVYYTTSFAHTHAARKSTDIAIWLSGNALMTIKLLQIGQRCNE